MSRTIREAFLEQGRACDRLGSPFMARLMPLVGTRLDAGTAVGARCLSWRGEPGPAGDSLPLRLAGALHGLMLDGSEPSLATVYPPAEATDDALWQAVDGALRHHEARIMAWLERAPQTNEVRRAAAVIAGIWWALGQVGPQPVVLSEIGASAGLNLQLDRFSVALDDALHGPADAAVTLRPEWRGTARPVPCPVMVADRRGVDLSPLDVANPLDALLLQSYLWPDQPERLARTRAAMALVAAPPDAGDAAPWIEARLAAARPGMLHVVYTTIAAQYLPAATQARVAASLTRAGGLACADAPILHLAFEADGDAPGAGLRATLWRGGAPSRMLLGRMDFHGAWIDWSPRPEP